MPPVDGDERRAEFGRDDVLRSVPVDVDGKGRERSRGSDGDLDVEMAAGAPAEELDRCTTVVRGHEEVEDAIACHVADRESEVDQRESGGTDLDRRFEKGRRCCKASSCAGGVGDG